MKLFVTVFLVWISVHPAFADPKVDSVAKYRITYSAPAGAGQPAINQVAEMSATVKKIDPTQNLVVIETSVTVNGQTETVPSDEKLDLLVETRKLGAIETLAEKCTLTDAKRVMALDPSADAVLSASVDEIDTIYGKLKTCKLVQVDAQMVKSTVWVSDKSLGFVKLVIDDQLKSEVELVDYKE